VEAALRLLTAELATLHDAVLFRPFTQAGSCKKQQQQPCRSLTHMAACLPARLPAHLPACLPACLPKRFVHSLSLAGNHTKSKALVEAALCSPAVCRTLWLMLVRRFTSSWLSCAIFISLVVLWL
jgi:hypothetical protein